MSSTRTPKSSPKKLRSVSIDPQSFAELTPAEIKLIQFYRQVDDSVQDHFMRAIELCTDDPITMRHPPKGPTLRLIDGGAK
jgi:hypothetical protein